MRALLLVLVVVGCSRSPAHGVGQDGAARASSSVSSSPSRGAPANGTGKTPPAGFVEAVVVGAGSVGPGHAVLLVDTGQRRAVPIFIGGTEGQSIELRLEREKPPRPLTHDLLDSALRELGARVHSARVVKLEDG
ncbi:MAG TPA: bifunctional nuclease family protein, partial [Polyangiaceae bacterium]